MSSPVKAGTRNAPNPGTGRWASTLRQTATSSSLYTRCDRSLGLTCTLKRAGFDSVTGDLQRQEWLTDTLTGLRRDHTHA